MNEVALQNNITDLMAKFGDLGVFVGMFLESSIIPIPSEVVVIGAGAMGISVVSIVIFGSLGATLGSIVGYMLGRYAAMPVILKLGRFILIKPHHIAKAEAFAKKYGAWSVLLGRILPVVPFKVFSIASGITKIPFIPFILCTLIGVLPRMFLLAVFGSSMLKYKKPILILIGFVIIIFLAVKLSKAFYNGNNSKENEVKGGA